MKFLIITTIISSSFLFNGCLALFKPNKRYTVESNLINNVKHYSDINCEDIETTKLKENISKLVKFSEKRDKYVYETSSKLLEVVDFKSKGLVYCELKKEILVEIVSQLENYVIAKENYE